MGLCLFVGRVKSMHVDDIVWEKVKIPQFIVGFCVRSCTSWSCTHNDTGSATLGTLRAVLARTNAALCKESDASNPIKTLGKEYPSYRILGYVTKLAAKRYR